MASFNKFNNFALNMGDGHFDFASDTLKVFLSDSAPVATQSPATYSSISGTEIASGNGYTTGGTAVGSVGWSQTGGTSTLVGNEVVWTASGGSIAQFRYCILYDSTTGYLIGWWDYGSEVNITSGNTFTLEPSSDATGGTILTVA
jgi:hypothetical protein